MGNREGLSWSSLRRGGQKVTEEIVSLGAHGAHESACSRIAITWLVTDFQIPAEDSSDHHFFLCDSTGDVERLRVKEKFGRRSWQLLDPFLKSTDFLPRSGPGKSMELSQAAQDDFPVAALLVLGNDFRPDHGARAFWLLFKTASAASVWKEI